MQINFKTFVIIRTILFLNKYYNQQEAFELSKPIHISQAGRALWHINHMCQKDAKRWKGLNHSIAFSLASPLYILLNQKIYFVFFSAFYEKVCKLIATVIFIVFFSPLSILKPVNYLLFPIFRNLKILQLGVWVARKCVKFLDLIITSKQKSNPIEVYTISRLQFRDSQPYKITHPSPPVYPIFSAIAVFLVLSWICVMIHT